MMALNMPMQPSSKTPMMDLRRRRSAATCRAIARALAGTRALASGRTWLAACRTTPVLSQPARFFRKKSSVKSALQSVEYFTPALVREPLRLSMPTSPGAVPDQLATVRMGPRWDFSPARTWWEYCQTASATISGALGSSPAKIAMPSFWELMKPWATSGLNGWARTSR